MLKLHTHAMGMNVDLQQHRESGPDKGKTKTIRLSSVRCAERPMLKDPTVREHKPVFIAVATHTHATDMHADLSNVMSGQDMGKTKTIRLLSQWCTERRRYSSPQTSVYRCNNRT